MFWTVILTPDAVTCKLHGPMICEINSRWDIRRMELRTLSAQQVELLYDKQQPFWIKTRNFMISGKSVVMLVIGEGVDEYVSSVQDRIQLKYFPNGRLIECFNHIALFPGARLW